MRSKLKDRIVEIGYSNIDAQPDLDTRNFLNEIRRVLISEIRKAYKKGFDDGLVLERDMWKTYLHLLKKRL